MVPAAPFNPPSANLPGKPFVPEWAPPPVTKQKHDFAQLESIDLSLLDSEDPAVVENLIQQVKIAIRDDGFLFLENYGVSLEQVGFTLNSSKYHSVTNNVFPFNSSIASSLLRSIYTRISAKKIRSVFFFIPTPVSGLVTNIHLGSKYEEHEIPQTLGIELFTEKYY